MKRCFVFVLVFALVAAVGCGSQNKGKGKSGEKVLTVNPDATVTVAQGKTADFDVAITRKKFDEDVQITVSNLPDGVKVENGTTQKIAKSKTEIKLTLKATKDAKPVKDHEVKVNAEGGGVKTTKPATIKVTIEKAKEEPSAKTKEKTGEDMEAKLKKWRKELTGIMNKSLKEANETLAKVNEQLKDTKGEARKHLETVKKKLQETRDHLQKQMDKIGEQTAPQWQKFKTEVGTIAEEVQQRTQAAIKALMGKNKDEKKSGK